MINSNKPSVKSIKINLFHITTTATKKQEIFVTLHRSNATFLTFTKIDSLIIFVNYQRRKEKNTKKEKEKQVSTTKKSVGANKLV